ncbi:dr1-associated corepressor homolog [Sabethes cyaneus]|uniref:dr1-associated corepressor homolog n=1 Tax=Sabethes cyaneus TaxID=53552 RepID=UPI00237D9B82|nr:dr1-associated corepressor homolog [Sabethes cyaneus]
MPSKKKKYNARFPAGRIKKIMQTDEEVGKVAQAVPVIISRTLELFVESLLTKTLRITNARNAKTLSPSHMKQCIISENRFDFLRDLVKNIPDIGVNEEQHSGSETGFGNETAVSPASTSTSSSNGGSNVNANACANEAASSATSSGSVLQRSESYAAAGNNYASVLMSQTKQSILVQQQQPLETNTMKRTLNHTNSLNFYKEISMEDSVGSGSATASSVREPPLKLSRLHSAPAGTTITTTNSPPFKIDILPKADTTPATTGVNQTNLQKQTIVSSGNASGSSSFKITYKIGEITAGSSGTAATKSAKLDQSVIKLDYSNLQLPMTLATSEIVQQPKPAVHVRSHQLQPTIKIDLSNITNFSSKTVQPGSAMSIKQVPSTPTASTPSTPLSALSSASSTASSSTASSNKSPYIFQQTTAGCSSATQQASSSTSAAGSGVVPLYAAAFSAIPGMDEDYDDI